ncbi:MAG: hypothetical protein HC897_03580 [Thermoanaerobaculia bacterium]|nr:hypothetical protein [Thermoanaerobaculia bacterium]
MLGELVLFAAFDPASGWELWRSDGTGTGTVMVKDLVPGAVSSSPGNFAVLDGRVWFSARRADGREELWTSDGTAAGTRSIADLSLGGQASRSPRWSARGRGYSWRSSTRPPAPSCGRAMAPRPARGW